jgi:hypothetical protein
MRHIYKSFNAHITVNAGATNDVFGYSKFCAYNFYANFKRLYHYIDTIDFKIYRFMTMVC